MNARALVPATAGRCPLCWALFYPVAALLAATLVGHPARAAAALLAAALVVLPARAEDEEAAGYEARAVTISLTVSKYQEDPRFQALQAALPEARRKALVRLKERLDLDYRDQGTIEIRLLDLGDEGVKKFGEQAAITFTEKTADGDKEVILLFSEYLMSGLADLEEELTHEMLHAIHRERTSEEAYDQVPKWVREGLALWVAGQGPGRVQYAMQGMIEKGPDALLDGLEDPKHDLGDYAEDWLAFRYMEEKHGAARLRAFAKDLVSGKGAYRDLLQKHTGEAWTDFEKNARAFSLEHVRMAEGGRRARFLAAFEVYQKKQDYARAHDLLRELVAQEPDSYCAGLAAFYAARSLFALDRWDEAIPEFSDVAAGYVRKIGLIDDARYYVGACWFKKKDGGRATEHLRPVVRDFPASGNVLAKARLILGVVSLRNGKPDEAIADLEAALRFQPRSEVTDQLLATAAEAYLKQGDLVRARNALRNLTSFHPDSPRAADGKRKLAEIEAKAGAAESGLAGARAATARKDWNAVATAAADFLRTSPPADQEAEARWLLGLASHSLEQWEPAIEELARVLDRFPRSPVAADACYRLAKSCLMAKQYEQTVLHFERLNRDWPRHTYPASAPLFRGQALLELRRNAEALASFEAGDQRSEARNKWVFAYWIGRAQRALGNEVRAKESFRRAFELAPDPNHPLARKAREEAR